MSGGLVNNAEVIAYTASEAITYPGTLVKSTSTSLTVALCDNGEEPIGYAFTSTKHPVTGVATADVKVGIGALIEGQVLEIPLLATNAAIVIGDLVETATDGTVDLKSGAGWVVGYAQIAAATNAGATEATRYMKVRVAKRYASA
jgi:hypothetical protein